MKQRLENYKNWKEDALSCEHHGVPAEIISKTDNFLNHIFDAFETDHPEFNFDTLEIKIPTYEYNNILSSPRSKIPEEDFPEGYDYRKTDFYQKFIKGFTNPKAQQLFANMEKGDVKAIKQAIKDNSQLLNQTNESDGNTPLHVILHKIKSIADDSTKTAEFDELAQLATEIVQDYGSGLNVAQGNGNENTILHRAFWYAREMESTKARDFFLEIGIKLLNSVNDPTIALKLKEQKNKLNETIHDIIFKNFDWLLPSSKHVAEKIQPIYEAFIKRFNPQKIFEEINELNSDEISKCLTDNIKSIDQQDAKSGNTPIIQILVEINNLYISKSTILDSGQLKGKFEKLQEIAMVIIQHKPNLSLADKKGDTPLHHLLPYIINSEKQDQVDVFVRIGTELLKNIDEQELTKILNLKNEIKQVPKDKDKEKSVSTKQETLAQYLRNLATMKKLNSQKQKNLTQAYALIQPPIFKAIASADLGKVKACLEEKPSPINQKNNQGGNTPIIAVLVEMKKLYTMLSTTSPKLKEFPDSELVKLQNLQTIALEIIKHHPDLMITDDRGNTALHKVFWYASTLSQTEEELNIFLNIGTKLINELTPVKLKQISILKNDQKSEKYPLGETFTDNLYHSEFSKSSGSHPLIAKNIAKICATITPLLDKLKDQELEIDFSGKSLREAIEEEILTDSISYDRLIEPQFYPHPNHGHTFSKTTWSLSLEQKEENPINKNEFKQHQLIKNQAIVELLKILDDTKPGKLGKFFGRIDSDDNLLKTLMKRIKVWKESPQYYYQNNILLHQLLGVIEAYKKHQQQVSKTASSAGSTSTTTTSPTTPVSPSFFPTVPPERKQSITLLTQYKNLARVAGTLSSDIIKLTHNKNNPGSEKLINIHRWLIETSSSGLSLSKDQLSVAYSLVAKISETSEQTKGFQELTGQMKLVIEDKHKFNDEQMEAIKDFDKLTELLENPQAYSSQLSTTLS